MKPKAIQKKINIALFEKFKTIFSKWDNFYLTFAVHRMKTRRRCRTIISWTVFTCLESGIHNFVESLARIREFHGSFKGICDTFSIDLTEFDQIFKVSEEDFTIWDTDENGLIDALELFCGIILFADDKFEEKIRCNFSRLISY